MPTKADKSTLEIARQAVALARSKGAQQAAAAANRTRDVEVYWRDGKLDKISEATTKSLGMQLYVDGRYAQVTTSDLRPEALGPFIDNAVRLTRTLARDPYRSLPDPDLYQGQADTDLRLEDGGHEALSAEERRRIAREIAEAARAVPGSAAILSVTAGFSDSLSETVRVTSNGFSGAQRGTAYWMSAEVSVKDQDDRRPEDYAVAGVRFFGELPRPAEIGQQGGTRALSRRGARKGKSAVLPMVVENRAAGRLANFLLAPLSGNALQQKRSFLEGRQGQALFSPRLTLVDDPLIEKGLGSRLFDSEGIAARRIPLFERGTLKSYYIDWYYGRKLKMAPTTGRLSNLRWTGGDRDRARLVADVRDGIFVTGFIGGNSNGTTGDFSLGVYGFRIQAGQLAGPISEMNISGNHLELWKQLVAVGNDPYPHSPLRTPTLVFDKVQFAGT